MNVREQVNQMYTWIKYGCYQRSLHYHNTPGIYTELYRKQLAYVKRDYEIQTPEQLKNYLNTGKRKERPSLMIGAFDGYRNQHDVLWKLLEEYKIPGWFLLVTDFIDSAGSGQEELLTKYRMQWLLGEYEDGRYAMNWEEAKEISRRHTIVNHTSTHYYLTEDSKEPDLTYEILNAQALIEKHLNQRPKIFSWLGGAWLEQNREAADMLARNGYQLLIGYRLEYMDGMGKAPINQEAGTEPVWEMAVPGAISRQVLSREVRYCDQIMSNIGWYSAVPAILPCYRPGHLVHESADPEDQKLAEHFAALALYLIEERGMGASAVNLALDTLAVTQIGEEFPFH